MSSFLGRLKKALFSFLLAASFASGALAQTSNVASAALAADDSAGAVTAEIKLSRTAATPGATYEIGVLLKHKPGWHTYWKNPGDAGAETRIEWTLPRHWKIRSLGWPLPKTQKLGDFTSFVYEGDVLFPFLIEVPWGSPHGLRTNIRAKVSWTACKTTCVPQETELKVALPVAVSSKSTEDQPLFTETHALIPEPITNTAITAIADGRVICIELPPTAGIITEKVEFLPKSGNPFISQTAKVASIRGQNTTLFLTLKDDKSPAPELLDGVLVADGGPANNGWAIETQIEVTPGALPTTEKLEQKKQLLSPTSASVLQKTPITAGQALWFAFIGGLILNLMPCVFPVLSLKILHIADKTRRRGTLAANGIAFLGGVLLSTSILAFLLLSVRSLGYAVGWGFQLQTPWVVAALALLFFAITLNLLGVFEFTAASHLADSRAAKALPSSGPWDSFSVGILTVVVASPCTAPFMGAALGYAITQPAFQAYAVFLTLGFGIALPWVLLMLFPSWIQWLPKPGIWMQRLRQAMALPMLLAFLWLVWVLAHQVNLYGLITLFLAAGALTLFLWAYGREQYGRGNARILKIIALSATVACLVTLAINDFTKEKTEEHSAWAPFTTSAVERALHEGKPVIIDFTASWCITCQFNKVTALHTEETEKTLTRYGYRRFVADWTSRDAQITQVLNAFGRTGVPLCVIYNLEGRPTLLPELLTKEVLIKAIKEAADPALIATH